MVGRLLPSLLVRYAVVVVLNKMYGCSNYYFCVNYAVNRVCRNGCTGRTCAHDTCTVTWIVNSLRRVDEVITKDFTNSPSKTEVGTRCFPTQCYLDVYKGELYFWIIRIIADNSEKVSGARFRCCAVDGHFLRQQL
jgi:hypothetical protein